MRKRKSNFGNISANGTQSGFDYWSAGALAGFDYTFANAGVGFMANYDYIKGHEDTTGQFHINEAHGSLYGTISPKRLPELSFNAILGGSYEWYGFDRTITTSTEKPVGRTRGGEFDALLGVEYTIENRGKMTKGLKIVPLVSAQYVYLRVGEYDETNGGSYNFHYDSQTVQSLRSTLGSRLGYTWTKDSSFKLVSELDFAWQREFMNHNLEVGYTTIAFVQPNSTAIIPGSGRNLILAGIDLEAVFKEKYGCNASYDFEWNEQFLDHSFQVGFNANF
jgi:outer membrane autotransporter protein